MYTINFNLDSESCISGTNTEIIHGKEIGEQCSARQTNAYDKQHPYAYFTS